MKRSKETAALDVRLRADGWCRVSEAAQITGLNLMRVYRMIKKWDLPTQRINTTGTTYVKLAAVLQALGQGVSQIAIEKMALEAPPAPPLTFTAWLKTKRKDPGALGRFAEIWLTLDERPRSSEYADLLSALCACYHADEAAAMLQPVFKEYTDYKKQRELERLQHATRPA